MLTSHEARGVAGKEDSKTVQLVDRSETSLWRQGRPDLLLRIQSRDAVQRRVHVARRDRVDADAVLGPLRRERFAEMDDAGLGGVVAGLLLGVVDDGARHGGDEDDGAGLLCLDQGPSDGLGHEERAGEVDVDETAEHAVVVFLSLDVGVGDAGRVDEDVWGAERLDDGVDGFDDGAAIAHVDLVELHGSACSSVQLGGGLVAEILVGVEDDDDLGAGLSTCLRHRVTQTTSTTGF